MLTELFLAAVGASCFFLLGAWFGHRAGGRAQESAELELERVLSFQVRIVCTDLGEKLYTVRELVRCPPDTTHTTGRLSDPLRRRVEDLERWGGAITDRVYALELGPQGRDAFAQRALETLELIPDKWPDEERYAQHAALCAGVVGGLKRFARDRALLPVEEPSA